ncbi:MAG TPA: DUF3237 domain-containing protein [Dehalococcoidia bacterium]|nr:DUF3237 domain-containing protein [Dehalococcoidia bacterium]
MSDFAEPTLSHLFDMRIDLEPPQMIGPTPAGMRQVFIVKGGHFEGPEIKGEVLPGGGDWALLRSDGAIQLDVRATARTDDGALIYATYSGLIHGPMDVLGRAMAGEDVPLSEYYFFTNPMFHTASEKYAWLNRRIAVARGRVIPNGVAYRVWAIS